MTVRKTIWLSARPAVTAPPRSQIRQYMAKQMNQASGLWEKKTQSAAGSGN
jgi:hypothetical protein